MSGGEKATVRPPPGCALPERSFGRISPLGGSLSSERRRADGALKVVTEAGHVLSTEAVNDTAKKRRLGTRSQFRRISSTSMDVAEWLSGDNEVVGLEITLASSVHGRSAMSTRAGPSLPDAHSVEERNRNW